jgi:hypothetical protein
MIISTSILQVTFANHKPLKNRVKGYFVKMLSFTNCAYVTGRRRAWREALSFGRYAAQGTA